MQIWGDKTNETKKHTKEAPLNPLSLFNDSFSDFLNVRRADKKCLAQIWAI